MPHGFITFTFGQIISMKKIFLLAGLAIQLSVSNSQNKTISELMGQIKGIETEIDEMYAMIDTFQLGLEKLKLQYCHTKIEKYGLPKIGENEQIIHHQAMVLSYNEQHEQANWVAHLVTRDVESGNVSRTNDFRADPLVKTGTAAKDDYWYSGYDRGHLAPSADFRWSQTALSESYFYSNMSPQRPELNREGWAQLENKIRDWAVANEEILVVTGPVLHDSLPVIKGTNTVSVPQLYYKIVVDYTMPEIKGIGFIFPNGPCNTNILAYAVSIDSIQKLTGIDFFHQLSEFEQHTIEDTSNILLWEKTMATNIQDTEPLSSKKGQWNTVEVKENIGKKGKVCGTVVATKYHIKGQGSPTFVNLDRKFPNQVFSFTIWESDRKNFSYEPEKELLGKQVCVTGKIGEYKGTPKMEIDNEKQVEFLEDLKEK